MTQGFLRFQGAHFFQNFVREGFRDAAEPDVGAFHTAGAFLYGFRHPVDVAVHGIVDD